MKWPVEEHIPPGGCNRRHSTCVFELRQECGLCKLTLSAREIMLRIESDGKWLTRDTDILWGVFYT
jgi:hypothetical protein